MKYVEIYKLQSDGSQLVTVTCFLRNESVVCEGDANFVASLLGDGIPDIANSEPGHVLTQKDGLHFLEGLKFAFKSGYMNASDVMDDATPLGSV